MTLHFVTQRSMLSLAACGLLSKYSTLLTPLLLARPDLTPLFHEEMVIRKRVSVGSQYTPRPVTFFRLRHIAPISALRHRTSVKRSPTRRERDNRGQHCMKNHPVSVPRHPLPPLFSSISSLQAFPRRNCGCFPSYSSPLELPTPFLL